MLVRLFTGTTWQSAEELGDVEFDALPAIGHQVAIAASRRWQVGEVSAIVHRLVDGEGAADIALLLAPLTERAAVQGEALPLALLDGQEQAPPRPANVPRAGPWGS